MDPSLFDDALYFTYFILLRNMNITIVTAAITTKVTTVYNHHHSAFLNLSTQHVISSGRSVRPIATVRAWWVSCSAIS